MAEPTEYTRVVKTLSALRYTDVSQYEWFKDLLEQTHYGINVRLDEDGTTILYWGYYRLPLGWWLIQYSEPVSDEFIRSSLSDYRPVADWPPSETGGAIGPTSEGV